MASLSAHAARQHGYNAGLLRRACASVVAQGLPLRDAIVLREAERLASMQTDRARSAWSTARHDLVGAVPESTFRIWLEPLSLVGEDGTTLILAAPEKVRTWVERRYTALIGEALQDCSDFTAVQFVPSGEAR